MKKRERRLKSALAFETEILERLAIKNIVLIFTGLLIYVLGYWANYIATKGFTQEIFTSLSWRLLWSFLWNEHMGLSLLLGDVFYIGFLDIAFSIGDFCLFVAFGLIFTGLILQYKEELKWRELGFLTKTKAV